VAGLPRTDGVIVLRAMREGDAASLIARRDEEFHRWLGAGSPDPCPTAVIELDGAVVGWVDHDRGADHPWLTPGHCNVGYHVFAEHRRTGVATRAVRLLLDLLREEAACTEATFLVDAENEPSLHVARAVGAAERDRFPNADGRVQVLLVVSLAPAATS
jgi:RimJ/RimL family protein N-acetyltransferase